MDLLESWMCAFFTVTYIFNTKPHFKLILYVWIFKDHSFYWSFLLLNQINYLTFQWRLFILVSSITSSKHSYDLNDYSEINQAGSALWRGVVLEFAYREDTKAKCKQGVD